MRLIVAYCFRERCAAVAGGRRKEFIPLPMTDSRSFNWDRCSNLPESGPLAFCGSALRIKVAVSYEDDILSLNSRLVDRSAAWAPAWKRNKFRSTGNGINSVLQATE